MAELLSMTLLSVEPASVSAKSQAVLSQDGTTQPDQSFAATLAAEVNGKTPEKPAKAQNKTRQNTASEQDDAKELSQAQSVTAEQPRAQELKTKAGSDSAALDEDEALAAQTKEPEQDEAQPEQSHWLNLLEKAKSLQDRLDKSERTGTVTKGKPDDKLHQQKVAESAAELTAELSGKPGAGLKPAAVSIDSSDAAVAVPAKSQAEKIKAAEALLSESSTAATSGKSAQPEVNLTKTAQLEAAALSADKTKQNDKASAADAQQLAESAKTSTREKTTDQQLTAQELKALALMSQTDKKSPAKAEVTAAIKAEVTSAIKQEQLNQKSDSQTKTQPLAILPEPMTEPVSESAIVELGSGSASPEHRLLKEGGLLQGKIFATLDKSAEKAVKPLQQSVAAELKDTQSAADAQKLTPESMDPLAVTPTSVGAKALLQADTVQSSQKNAVATAHQTTLTEKDGSQAATSETDSTEDRVLTAVDTKLSVQAQSAAAVVAPVAQQNKASAPEVKMTTEEALKQVQTVAVASQSESGSSSSSADPQHKHTADMLPTAADPQKPNAAPVSDTQSFASQLKSNLEKTASGISVAGRELQSEQKQMDQLGQKLNLIQPQASHQLKDQMLMMVKDKVHTAEIRLDPSELGSMQIKINLQQDQMSVQFMVQQGNAKELMEQQMPKLKELLQQQGIELSQGSVQQQNQSSSGQEGGRRTAAGHAFGTAGTSADDALDPGLIPAKNSDRVVDYYA